jgi:hypothetical protein
LFFLHFLKKDWSLDISKFWEFIKF